jgi:hypothetical protein
MIPTTSAARNGRRNFANARKDNDKTATSAEN